MKADGELLHIDRRAAVRLRDARLQDADAARVAGALKALSDPTRLNLALSLEDSGELCVCDLAWIAERAQNLVSYHMKVLRQEGLVSARKHGRMTMYALTPAGEDLVKTANSLLRETA